MCVCVCKGKYLYVHVCMRACVRACVHACVRACVRACVCVWVRMHALSPSFITDFLPLSFASRILDILDRRITFQLQYQLIFCLWMLSFNVSVVERMKE